MKKLLLILRFFLLLCLFTAVSCKNQFVKDSSFRRAGETASPAGGKKKVTLVTWNVQTFFDAVTVGTEYKDFTNSERWNQEKYSSRLNKLCDIMTTLNPDIFVMEEIENEAVVQDIANTFAGASWDKKHNWQYACFSKETGSSIGCAVFSRYELVSLKTHNLDIRSQSEEQPSFRPLMQVKVLVGNQELELFVNHWKSKSGGQEETEIWRDWQELVLAETADSLLEASGQEQAPALIMCGDFNRSAEDFVIDLRENSGFSSNTILRSAASRIELYSPWFRSDGEFVSDTGSYYYDGEWERIDNILLSGPVELCAFSAVTEAPLTEEDGRPFAYKLYTGEGYSDHLPLKCVFSILI